MVWFGEDPLQLAESVREKLAKGGDEAKTIDLVRFASKSMECVVSWNHLIDHYMAKGSVKQALKLYNEMKKRAQKPDSYTYMIVLRGLGNNAHINTSIGHALAVYHSMSAPNSRIPPSTMHVNATLRVCARANDMNALWAVASKLPENGPGAADALTYTIILQGMRQEALMTPKGMSAAEIAHKREAAIIDGRRIWEDVVSKWRAGNIIIDEELACAMGHLLLIGQRPRDWDDIFSLFEQTMDIPRLVPLLGTFPKPDLRLPDTPLKMRIEDFKPIDRNDDMRRGGEFDPVKLEKTVGGGRRSVAYAKPGNHTLSLILEACLKLTHKTAADGYWNLLTAPDSWGVVPDDGSIHMYMRILRQARASTSAVDVLTTEFENAGLKLKAKTFRIAMSACVRNKHNPNAFANANAVLDLMANHLRDPDPRTLVMYANLLANLSDPEKALDGLDKLGPQFINVKERLGRSKIDGHGDSEALDRNAAMEFLWGLKACYDRLINKAEVPKERIAELQARKRKIDAFVSRQMRMEKIKRGVDVRDPDLNPARRADEEAKQKESEEDMDEDIQDDQIAQREDRREREKSRG
ncbi:hypothetical protein MPH_02671 [Macrophomina phaseolina MS6]|uniref:Pentatricopeptide repeat protein n=1 Tax=Macrophomina phaseolina (strain MS6) TaxID=1126212 RepID=K2STN1_MACPH|nr:hypothetical protein MPH_02671 [Macrophomina phaseolina MS6]